MTTWTTEPDGPGLGDDRYGERPGAEKVYCCEHGEPVATRTSTGIWIGHDRCFRCRWSARLAA